MCHMSIFVYIGQNVCVHVYVYVYIYIYVCACVCVCVYVHVDVCMYIYRSHNLSLPKFNIKNTNP